MSDGVIPALNADDVDELEGFIKDYIKKSDVDGVVIGLSGGLDSAVVTKLAVDAIGADHVLNVFMPSRVTPASDYRITSELCNEWGVEYKIVDVQPIVDALIGVLLTNDEAPLERGNIAARCRMIVLFNQAKKRNYIVLGTSNQSELMMGYFTKFGDGACDLMPLAGLYKTNVRQLAKMIGVPEEIISRPPTAGLWEGQTDEEEMGISYECLDKVLYGLETGLSDAEIASSSSVSKEDVAKVRSTVRSTEHKRMLPVRPDLLL